MDYRRRMFRGAKIEDCIEDFIQMEQTTREQMNEDSGGFSLIAKGMNNAYRYVINRMVRDFEYKKGELSLKMKFEELEKLFRRLSHNNMEQSKKNLYETIQESYYKEDIPEEAMEDVKELSPDFQKGMFEGMSFAYEQVANYISILVSNSNQLTDKSATDLVALITSNSIVKNEEIVEESETYQQGFVGGMKASFNLSKMEVEEKFNLNNSVQSNE
ncbi:hypothetical protein QA612_22265 [Evansella sp. AB-P1]|uniref:hypothetical protein n=1 Tax=Evansella sp. AB-P1 TaxID=3037653 RepID=UPI00241F6E48|nr:hypothetical protein [Evansella sp. AB-P1]MDG5790168.1 hypothetical protein [Evansella sp. AB-P1]